MDANPLYFCDIDFLKESCIGNQDESCTFIVYNAINCNTSCECRKKIFEEYENVCDVEQMEKSCLSTPDAICEFKVDDLVTCRVFCGCVSENPPSISCPTDCPIDENMICSKVDTPFDSCPFSCECVSANPPIFCDIDYWKESCIGNEDESCTFTLFNSDKCNASCDCKPKTNEEYIRFCDVEGFEKSCLSTPQAICEFSVNDVASCGVLCACVSANPPSVSCEDYLAGEKKACEQRSSGKRSCRYVMDEENCSGECICDKRKRCYPVV